MTKKVSLSKSDLWKLQKDFYQEKGIEAWNTVPFHSTSNPLIANNYANQIISFMLDNIGKYTSPQAFYIIELAAGTGAFSFYLLKRLKELQVILDMGAVKFVYVMTDAAKKNIEFWRTHPAFQSDVNAGLLDFAAYTAGVAGPVKLLNSGKVMSVETVTEHTDKPLILLSNYLFDTIPHDIFRTRGDTIEAGFVHQSFSFDMNQFTPNESMTLDDLGAATEYETITSSYYNDPHLDAILEDYRQNLKESNILFPIGSIQCIDQWMKISQGKLLLISTDKGYARHISSFGKTEVDVLNFHGGCFSAMVNFNAIGQYFEQRGGQYFHQSFQQLLHTSVFLLGERLENLPQTTKALLDHVSAYNPADCHAVLDHFRQTKSVCSLQTILAYLNISFWDPYLLNEYIDIIMEALKEALPTEVEDFAGGMEKIASNFYYLPQSSQTLVNLGLFFQEIGVYEKAVTHFQQYLNYYGSENETLLNVVNYNLGLCYYHEQQPQAALSRFKAAMHAQSDPDMMARGWIARIEEEMTTKKPNP